MPYYAPTRQDTKYLSVVDLSLTIGSWQSQMPLLPSQFCNRKAAVLHRPPGNVVEANEKALSIIIW